MKTAIIGLPMVGKTSLFTILTGVHESTRVGSMEARIGITKVPDARLEVLAQIFEPPKITHATVEYLDFPAISKEALRDPSYLASMRVADALAQVLRLFESDTVPHEKGSVDPVRDLQDVDTELILSDLVVVEKRMERLEKDRRKPRAPNSTASLPCWSVASRRWNRIRRCARWICRRTRRKPSGASSFFRRSPCCSC